MVKSSRLHRLKLFVLLTLTSGAVATGYAASLFEGGGLRRLWISEPPPTGDLHISDPSAFLQEHPALWGLDANPEMQIGLDHTVQTAMGQRYVFQQTVYGLPVFEAHLILNVSNGDLLSVFNALATAHFERRSAALSASSAYREAIQAVGNPPLRSEETVELGYDIGGDLVYRIRIPASDPAADWEVWINAVNGDVLRKTDRRIFTDGTGRVFIPDPKTALEDNSLTDMGDLNAAIPEAAYSLVTLYDLAPPVGGEYYLDGPFVSTSATVNRAHESSPIFNYWRQDDRFEEVMVYYHIDREQRYFQDELQTYNANNRVQICNVNGTPDDQSWYSPFDRTITYGYGGVDDAEDADVILHEYGHAVQDDINRFWTGGHTGAMGEGFGDYLAGGYSLGINQNFQPNWVFNWDGHNEFWAGRILNSGYHYPENAGGEVHDSGQLWSAGLMDVWWDIPDRTAWDRIVLQHHFLLGNGATMADAAAAILTTELALYGGIYRSVIVDHFGARGFINAAGYYPTITHTPLPDTEDTLQTAFEVTAQVTSPYPLDPNALYLYWRADQNPFQQQLLTAAPQPNEYHAFIPGPFNGQLISYYLTAADTLGMGAFSPAGAPVETYQFYVGPDNSPPQISQVDSLSETVFLSGSRQVHALASDNIGVGSVTLFWQVGSGDWQSSPMAQTAADTFAGNLNYSVEEFGELVYYFVRAVDSSSRQNVTDSPTRVFQIAQAADLDDFEGPLGPWIFNGNWGVTSQAYHSGYHSIEDSPGTLYPPTSDTWAQWGESWNLSGFLRAWLVFWEKHLLEEGHDFGRLEISADGGPWQTLLEVTGLDNDWMQREISLETYCGGSCEDVRIRFRTVTDAQQNFFGWFIDDLSLRAEIIVPVNEKPQAPPTPRTHVLEPAHPNPFNAATMIHFTIAYKTYMQLKVYNVEGQLIQTLTEGTVGEGRHSVLFDGIHLPSGIYFCVLQAGDFQAIRKLLLIK
jgi:hypothetical protein